MRICLTNLGAYNEGRLMCRWLELPYTDTELEATLKAIGIGGRYEEIFISDYETNTGLRIGEYDRLDDLNEAAECIEGLDTYELMTLQAIIEHEAPDASDIPGIIDRLDEYHLYSDISTDAGLGRYWLYESGCYDLERFGNLANYLDCAAFGRDIRLETPGDFTQYGWLECS